MSWGLCVSRFDHIVRLAMHQIEERLYLKAEDSSPTADTFFFFLDYLSIFVVLLELGVGRATLAVESSRGKSSYSSKASEKFRKQFWQQ